MSTDRREAGTGRQLRRGFRTSTLLSAVAAIPLLGALSIGWQSVTRAGEQSAAADMVEQASEQAVDLVRTESALFDELVWRSVQVASDSVGIEATDVTGILGREVPALLTEAEARVDRAMEAAGLGELEGDLQVARAADAASDASLESYRGLLEDVGARFDGIPDYLADPTMELGGAGVPQSVAVLGWAVELRQLLTDQFRGYHASAIQDDGSAEEELVGLIGLRGRYDELTEVLRSSPAVPRAVTASLERMEADADFAAFDLELDELVAGALAQGTQAGGSRVPPNDSATADFPSLAPLLSTIERSSRLTSEMLDEAIAAVRTAIDDVRRDDAADIRSVYTWLAALVAISVAAVALAARAIVRPLRSLQTSAHQLWVNPAAGDGGQKLGGPSEVRSASKAISEAAHHIQQATRQADALAAGDLDAAVLDGKVSCGSGASLHDSVATLRESLVRQEEFRHRLAHEAIHDCLTHLPNRANMIAGLESALERSRRSGSQLAVLFLDLDDFKDINDLHGHHTGDAVLVEVARRLEEYTRSGDLAGRLGGDEFLVIAEPVRDEAEAIEIARRLLDVLGAPVDTPSAAFTAGASIGIAMSTAGEGSADQLVRDADLALYRAKELGRSGVHVCDEKLRSSARETSSIAEGIRAAIRNNELLLHFQPIVGARTRKICSAEALVRWQRPGDHGLSPPSNFIGVAERSSLIIDIDLWVLENVSAQLASWERVGLPDEFAVSVNISGRHFASGRVVGDILSALERHEVEPRRLIVEITEGALLADLGGVARKLEALRGAGVRVSIDDFGTGYTSLAHLRSLPFDILKIDRTFAGYTVERRYEAVVSKLMIDAGHLLGAVVVAEGIETIADADTLTRMGVDELQGYHLFRPESPDRVWEAITAEAVEVRSGNARVGIAE